MKNSFISACQRLFTSVAAIAHEAKLPLLVDATFTTPYLLKPFAHGAEMFAHGYTFGGHPVSTAEGLANLQAIEDALRIGRDLTSQFEKRMDLGAVIDRAAGALGQPRGDHDVI